MVMMMIVQPARSGEVTDSKKKSPTYSSFGGPIDALLRKMSAKYSKVGNIIKGFSNYIGYFGFYHRFIFNVNSITG
jgi:hypothetical protein